MAQANRLTFNSISGFLGFVLACVLLSLANDSEQCEIDRDLYECLETFGSKEETYCELQFNECKDLEFEEDKERCACEQLLQEMQTPRIIKVGVWSIGLFGAVALGILGSFACKGATAITTWLSFYFGGARPFLNVVTTLWKMSIWLGVTCFRKCKSDLSATPGSFLFFFLLFFACCSFPFTLVGERP